MIRVRRLPKPLLRRAQYEVEYRPPGADRGWHKLTAHPVFDLEQVIGTGDAWALIRAADEAWDGSTGQWVTVLGPGEEP